MRFGKHARLFEVRELIVCAGVDIYEASMGYGTAHEKDHHDGDDERPTHGANVADS